MPSLNPSTWLDEQDAELAIGLDLSTASLEQVVDTYYKQEAKRSRNPDLGNRAETQVRPRSWPTGLDGSLDLFAGCTPARSAATLTKCASYRVAWWFVEKLCLDNLREAYNEADSAARSLRDPHLQNTLLQQLSALKPFRKAETTEMSSRKSLSVPVWFYNRADRYASILGMHPADLISIGMEWFITLTIRPNLDATNIDFRYSRDARLFEIYVAERLLDYDLIKRKAEGRRACLKGCRDGSFWWKKP